MTPIRVAMCGLGQWGPNLLRNLRQNPGFEVAALCDRDAKRLEEQREASPAAKLYRDVEQVAADPTIAAAVVATPAGLHEEHVRLLLESGKDVLVEKPLAMTLKGARALVTLAEDRGRVLMAGHTFLFNSAVQRVRREIASGTLGELQLILAQRMSLGHVRSDCNALWNLAPHDISILLYWLGTMPVSVSAHGVAFHEGHAQEDIALCVLEFPGRVMASLQVSWMNPVKVRQMTVVGSRRMLVYDDVNAKEPLTLYDQGIEEQGRRDPSGSFENFRLGIRRGPQSVLPVEQVEPLAAEVAHFLECLRSRKVPRGSGQEAIAIVSVLEALGHSMKLSGRKVEIG